LLRGERVCTLWRFGSLRARTSRKGREPREGRGEEQGFPGRTESFFKFKKKLWSWELVCAGKPFVKSFERGISLWMEEDFFSEDNLFIARFFFLSRGRGFYEDLGVL
jgi:hypothetical protein